MSKTQNIYKTLLDLSRHILHSRQLPIYSSRFSRKDFTTYQLMTLLVVKTFENKGYRAFVDWLEASKIPQWLKLKKLPHFTTLQKFASRQMIDCLEKLLKTSGLLGKKKCQHAGIDATGMTMRNASRHYEKRIGRIVRKRDFFKVALAADLDNQLILAVKFRKKARHDTKDFMPIWNKIKHLPFRWWYMDRGYDSNDIHARVFDAEKISFGCLKNKDLPIWRTGGVARKRAKRHAKYRQKNWRALVETINSVIKKCFGSVLHARNLHTMKIEMLLKLLTYNIYRLGSRNLAKLALLLSFVYAIFEELIWEMTAFWPMPERIPK